MKGREPMYTEINLTKISQIIQELKHSEHTLLKQYYSLADVILSLKRIQEEGIQTTCRKLNAQKTDLYTLIRRVQTMRFTLERIIRLYRNCEETISEYEDWFGGFTKGLVNPGWFNVTLKDLGQALQDAGIRFV